MGGYLVVLLARISNMEGKTFPKKSIFLRQRQPLLREERVT